MVNQVTESTPEQPAEEATAKVAAEQTTKADKYGVIVEHNVEDPNYKEFVAPNL